MRKPKFSRGFALRWTAAAAVLALVIGGAQAAGADQTQEADGSSNQTIVISGELPAGVKAQDVEVYLLPKDKDLRDAAVGTTLRALPFSAATVSMKGRSFTVSAGPDQAPRAALDDQGVAFLNVMVFTDRGTYQSNSSVRAVVDHRGQAKWVDTAEELVRVRGVAARQATPGGLLLQRLNDDTGKSVMLTKFSLLPGSSARARSGDPTPYPGCSYRKKGERVRSATIGTTYPVGNDTATMVVNSSTGASYGVASSFHDPGEAWGAFKAGSSKHTSSGWGFQWAGSNRGRSYRKGVEYGLFETWCARGCAGCLRQWFPTGETGGTSANRLTTRPNWTKCARVARGKWWRDKSGESAYSYGAAVKFASVIGIDLSISRQYNSSQKILYTLRAKRRMCGSNTWPSNAGKVMSRR
ncbi:MULTISPECIES: hypothetical protein [unclassified Nocardioides]|uniref:hypothetical protein n=1 Tax=unclassified Nocardioides TaxID=2615069 RepID=UPI000A7D8B6A|nr:MULTISPECIES: hypothetical protein [unclassified Nocardioides]